MEGALGEWALAIEHIGSTAIPDMPSKPIIDIAVGIRDFDEAFASVPLLSGLGYNFRGEVGVPHRHFFILGKPRTHHVHMYELTSEDWQQRIAFRDALRINRASAREYAELKQKLAQQFPKDIASYSAGKKEFIERLGLSKT